MRKKLATLKRIMPISIMPLCMMFFVSCSDNNDFSISINEKDKKQDTWNSIASYPFMFNGVRPKNNKIGDVSIHQTSTEFGVLKCMSTSEIEQNGLFYVDIILEEANHINSQWNSFVIDFSLTLDVDVGGKTHSLSFDGLSFSSLSEDMIIPPKQTNFFQKSITVESEKYIWVEIGPFSIQDEYSIDPFQFEPVVTQQGPQSLGDLAISIYAQTSKIFYVDVDFAKKSIVEGIYPINLSISLNQEVVFETDNYTIEIIKE